MRYWNGLRIYLQSRCWCLSLSRSLLPCRLSTSFPAAPTHVSFLGKGNRMRIDFFSLLTIHLNGNRIPIRTVSSASANSHCIAGRVLGIGKCAVGLKYEKIVRRRPICIFDSYIIHQKRSGHGRGIERARKSQELGRPEGAAKEIKIKNKKGVSLGRY